MPDPGRLDEARARYLSEAQPCPRCGTPPDELAWSWYESSEETWQNMVGRAGWVTTCGRCGGVVDFFVEIMN